MYSIQRSTWRWLALALVMIFTFNQWLLSPMIHIGAEDLRMLELYNEDEAVFFQDLSSVLQKPSKLFASDSLPATIISSGKSLLLNIKDRDLIVGLRVISLISSALITLFCFLIAEKLFGIFAGFAAAFWIATLPTFASRAAIGVPDTSQILFVVLSFYFILRSAQGQFWFWYLCSAFFAGLAFSISHTSILLVPSIFAGAWILLTERFGHREPFRRTDVFFLVTSGLFLVFEAITYFLTKKFLFFFEVFHGHAGYASLYEGFTFHLLVLLLGAYLIFAGIRNREQSQPLKRLTAFTLGALSFLVAFALTSPASFFGLGFLNPISSGLERLFSGQLTDLLSVSMGWGKAMTWSILGFAVFGILLRESREDRETHGFSLVPLMWLYVILMFSLGTIFITKISVQQVLFILPLMVILATEPLVWLLRVFQEFWGARSKRWGVACISLGMIVLHWQSLITVVENRALVLSLESNPRMTVGKWLLENVSPHQPILADSGIYVPSEFTVVAELNRESGSSIEELRPKAIVLDVERDGNYPKELLNSKVAYNLKKNFGTVQVFELVENVHSTMEPQAH